MGGKKIIRVKAKSTKRAVPVSPKKKIAGGLFTIQKMSGPSKPATSNTPPGFLTEKIRAVVNAGKKKK